MFNFGFKPVLKTVINLHEPEHPTPPFKNPKNHHRFPFTNHQNYRQSTLKTFEHENYSLDLSLFIYSITIITIIKENKINLLWQFVHTYEYYEYLQ